MLKMQKIAYQVNDLWTVQIWKYRLLKIAYFDDCLTMWVFIYSGKETMTVWWWAVKCHKTVQWLCQGQILTTPSKYGTPIQGRLFIIFQVWLVSLHDRREPLAQTIEKWTVNQEFVSLNPQLGQQSVQHLAKVNVASIIWLQPIG